MAASTKLGVSEWMSIAGVVLVVLGMGGGLSLYVYATKAEVSLARDKCQERHSTNASSVEVLKTHQTYQTAQLQRVQTRLENMDARQQTDSRNIERLLERFRVRVEEQPALKPLPEPSPPPPGLSSPP